MTKASIPETNRKLLDATLKTNHVTVGCERTAMLLQSASPDDELAKAAAARIEAARRNNMYVSVPCLGMIGAELWFSLLNEAAVTPLETAAVYLPLGQCSQCPANAKDNVEEAFMDAISKAEGWTGGTVELIVEPAELPIRHSHVLNALFGEREAAKDRREAFTGFFKELKATWDAAAADMELNAVDEVAQKRIRKDAYKKTCLASRLSPTAAKKGASGASSDAAKPVAPATGYVVGAAFNVSANPVTQRVATSRYALIEALGRYPGHADDLTVPIAAIDEALCTGCGECVKACPVGALFQLEPTGSPCGKVACDPVYCLGCEACVGACPSHACSMAEITGGVFLLDGEDGAA